MEGKLCGSGRPGRKTVGRRRSLREPLTPTLSRREREKSGGRESLARGLAARGPLKSLATPPPFFHGLLRKERQDPGGIGRIDRGQPKIDTGMSRVGNPNEARRHPRGGARELQRFLAAGRGLGKSLDDLFGSVPGKPA